MPKIKRALISVANKKGIVDFARGLTDLGIEILSTGGTARVLKEAGIPVKEVSQYTQSPSMLGGRVKTLHPRIHGALLALRDDPHQMEEVRKHSLELIDMVVVNLYPFFEVIQKEGVTLEEAIENIDIGGPTMLRSAAKNFPYVAAVNSPAQYPQILKELKENDGSISEDTSLGLAIRVFQEVSTYNAFIAKYLAKHGRQKFPEVLNLSFKKQKDLRYGENPHQKAAFYGEWEKEGRSLSSAQKIWGKNLSFNNLLDLDAALNIVEEFKEPAAVVIKHTNPCGVGSASNLEEAFRKAYSGDPLSAFGSIVGLNKVVD
ncbi:bifunctional phosphoribosylaminoimidazolecarboxamide formyltransferase/IMP cyclohydrolase, partial [Candidatus Aerophobetes bacterium]